MSYRPELTIKLKRKEFLEYYYLKEELVCFCRENGLPTSGGKAELTERIAYYLDTGKIKGRTEDHRHAQARIRLLCQPRFQPPASDCPAAVSAPEP